MKLNIGIIYGGKSYEHDVSIVSALQVYHAIDREKYNVELFYLTKENKIIIGENLDNIDTYKNDNFKNAEEIFVYQKNNKTYYNTVRKPKRKGKIIDCMLVCVHGKGVEDGTIAALLELNNIPYTCCDSEISSIIQNKVYTKLLLNKKGFKTIPYVEINELTEMESLINITYPAIIKPKSLGSSIGINICFDLESLKMGLKQAFKYENNVIIEPFYKNIKEYNCACIYSNGNYYSSAIEEIILEDDFYSYENKYLDKKITKHLPAIISIEKTDKLKQLTESIYKELNLFGVVRIDYIEVNEEIYINEINTIPGSLAYNLFTKEGLNFTKLIDILIKEAIIRKNNVKPIIEYESSILNKKINKIYK